MDRKIITHSLQETQNLAADLALDPPAPLFALVGPLGSGKTVFAQGFGQVLRLETMLSPTYTLIREYDIDHQNFKTLFHIDLYRLNSQKEIMDLGLEEIWSDKNNLILIEWADKIEKQLPEDHLRIDFQIKDQNTRQITIHQ